MKPTPPGWPRIAPSLWYEDAAAAIDWLCRAFGFRVRIRVDGPDGRVMHAELEYGEGLVMIGDVAARPERFPWKRSPAQAAGANTQNLHVYVDDVDAHYRAALAAGAAIDSEPSTVDYGPEHWSDRTYGCADPEGHHWWFAQRLRSAEERP